MISRNQDIVFGQSGQSLVWDAPEGRPSSITSVEVFEAHTGDDGTADAATTGSASVETNPSTTFDAASGAGQSDPTICNLTATTGVSSERAYLGTTADGVKEWIDVVSVDDGVAAISRNPLANAFASGDAFESTRISISVDGTWVADENNLTDGLDPNPGYRVRWTYVVAGVTYVHHSYFDLVRYKGAHGVTPAMVDAAMPGYEDMLPTYHRYDQGRRLIDAAYEDVKWDLHGIGRDDSAARDKDALDALVIRRFRLNRAEDQLMATGNTAAYELEKRKYDAFFENLFKVASKVDFAGSNNGASSGSPAPANIWRGR